MEELFENKLNDDLKNIIFSMITYSPPNELLIQINMYPYRKKYINLFYNYVMTNWTYCYIDALNIIWKLYYICIIAKGDIIWKDDNHLNYCLLNCEKYIPKEAYNIHTAELIRILNNSNISFIVQLFSLKVNSNDKISLSLLFINSIYSKNLFSASLLIIHPLSTYNNISPSSISFNFFLIK